MAFNAWDVSGCDCSCGAGVCKVCVTACSNQTLAGVTVGVFSGATLIFSGVTGVDGCVTLAGVAAGSYTIKITDGTTTLFSGTRSCPGTINIVLGSPPTGTACCGPCPIPTALNLTDPNGTIVANYIVGSSPATWFGNYFLSVSGYTTTGNCSPATNCHCGAATIALNIRYNIVCQPGGTLQVTRGWNTIICPDGTCNYGDWNAVCTCGAYSPPVCGFAKPTQFSPASSVTAAWSQCSPFLWAAAPVFDPASDAACRDCGGGALPDPVGGTVVLSA